jgi:hypothetical protein
LRSRNAAAMRKPSPQLSQTESGRVVRSYHLEHKDKDGRTPLSLAAGGGYEAVIKLLLETGKVDVDSKDKGGRAPLAWAARNGHEAAVKLLLGKGVDMESKDQWGRTPLLWAARGHEAVVEMPLEKGVVTDRLRSGNGLEIGEAKRSGSNNLTGLRGLHHRRKRVCKYRFLCRRRLTPAQPAGLWTRLRYSVLTFRKHVET